MNKYKLLGLICWKRGFSCILYLWHSPILHIFPLHTCFWTLKSRFLRLDLKLQRNLLLTGVIICKAFVQNSTKLMSKIEQLKQRLFLPGKQGTLAWLHTYRYTHPCQRGTCDPDVKIGLQQLVRWRSSTKFYIFLTCWVHLCPIYITFLTHAKFSVVWMYLAN